MKAVVLEISDGEATVMTKEGDVAGIRDEGYDIGQEIEIEAKVTAVREHRGKMRQIISAVSAAAVLLIAVGIGSFMYYDPYGTVSLDVNPSVEYEINRFDRVLSVSGVNDDGTDIIDSIDKKEIVNKDIETAIDNTINMIEEEGYFDVGSDNYIVLTANTREDDHSYELVERLEKTAMRHEGVKPITSKVSDDEIKDAHEQGLSAGKKMMVDRLQDASDEGFDRSKWKDRSVQDIVNEYDRIKNEPADRMQDEGTGNMSDPDPVVQDQNPQDKKDEGGRQPEYKEPDQDMQYPGYTDNDPGLPSSDDGTRPEPGRPDEGAHPPGGEGTGEDRNGQNREMPGGDMMPDVQNMPEGDRRPDDGMMPDGGNRNGGENMMIPPEVFE